MDQILDKRVILKGQKRICPICGIEKEITENFQFHRANNLFMRRCKDCANTSRNSLIKGKYSKLTKERRREMMVANIERQKVRRENKKKGTYIDGRLRISNPYTVRDEAKKIIRSCAKVDKAKERLCSLSLDFVEKILLSPCTYCGLQSNGLDRIDNSIGHTEDNCIPSCTICNLVRRDEFSVEEMKLLGPSIRNIKLEREEKIGATDFNYLFSVTSS